MWAESAEEALEATSVGDAARSETVATAGGELVRLCGLKSKSVPFIRCPGYSTQHDYYDSKVIHAEFLPTNCISGPGTEPVRCECTGGSTKGMRAMASQNLGLPSGCPHFIHSAYNVPYTTEVVAPQVV